MYLPQLIEFINDEDAQIQIDAIEAMTEVLDQLTKEEVVMDFVPCVIHFLDSEN